MLVGTLYFLLYSNQIHQQPVCHLAYLEVVFHLLQMLSFVVHTLIILCDIAML